MFYVPWTSKSVQLTFTTVLLNQQKIEEIQALDLDDSPIVVVFLFAFVILHQVWYVS